MKDGIKEIMKLYLAAVILCLWIGVCHVWADEKGLLS